MDTQIQKDLAQAIQSLIPVHNALIKAGLNDYLAYAKAQKHTRLLFDLPARFRDLASPLHELLLL